jgi:competence protein ComEC
LISLVRAPAAFEEDCRSAAVVVSLRIAPPGCAALVIDHGVLRTHGAISLRRVGDRWDISVSRPAGSERPWARRSQNFEPVELPQTITRPSARDATPRQEDLGPND